MEVQDTKPGQFFHFLNGYSIFLKTQNNSAVNVETGELLNPDTLSRMGTKILLVEATLKAAPSYLYDPTFKG